MEMTSVKVLNFTEADFPLCENWYKHIIFSNTTTGGYTYKAARTHQRDLGCITMSPILDDLMSGYLGMLVGQVRNDIMG